MSSLAYAANSNRLTSMTENTAAFRSYAYDNAGNTLTETRPGESFAYTYNKRNRLASVTRNAAAYATYGYNALEQLTSRNTAAVGAPAGTVHYIYDNDNHLIAEANAATGAITRDYIWLASNDNDPIDLPLAIAESSTLTTVHADHLGRPTRMTDASKATVWQAIWKPWGEIHQLSGTLTQNLRYPGQYFQIETGYHYNHHRNYDPITGRYTQPDPLRFVDGPSIYAYAKNSPYMYTDREGLKQIALGFAGSFTPGVGVGAGVGLQLEFPWFGDDDTPLDFKFFGNFSGRVGAELGAGIAFGELEEFFYAKPKEVSKCPKALAGGMSGDLAAALFGFGLTSNAPIVKRNDRLAFGSGNGGISGEIFRYRVKPQIRGGFGVSGGLGGGGSFSIRGFFSGLFGGAKGCGCN